MPCADDLYDLLDCEELGAHIRLLELENGYQSGFSTMM